MPQARLRHQVVGRGLGGRSESNDCGEKQHVGPILAMSNLKINVSLIKSVIWLATHESRPLEAVYLCGRIIARQPAQTGPIKKASDPFEPEAISLDTSYCSIRPLLYPPPVLHHPRRLLHRSRP